MKHDVQFAGATAVRLTEFFSGGAVPAPLASPLTADDCEGFLDQDRIACFTLKVPLAEIASGDVADYVQENAFTFPVDLDSLECQAVGASFDDDGFDDEFVGEVHLRMTCAIRTPEVED